MNAKQRTDIVRSNDDDRNRSTSSSFHDDDHDSPPKTLHGLLIGLSIGFLLSAGSVVLIRSLDNETDGLAALTQAMIVLVPAIALAMLVWFLQRGDSQKKINKLAVSAALFGGLGLGAAIWFTAPTEEGMRMELLVQNKSLIRERAEQLVQIRAKIDAIPSDAFDARRLDGELNGELEEQFAEFKQAPLNLLSDDYDLPSDWNTLIATDTDFVRLKSGADPETVMDRSDIPLSKFFFEDRYEYSVDSAVDKIAQVAFGDDYMWLHETQEFVKLIQQLRYVCVIRMTEKTEPRIIGAEFAPGFQKGQVFCFDLEQDEMIGAFTFATTNSRSVDYTFKESGTKDEKAHSAEFYLEKDLHENAWPAFWVRLHAIAENATSNHMHESLPYEDDWLNAAQQFAQAMKTAGKNATAVQGQQAGSQPTTNPPPRNADAILLTAEQLQEIKGLLRDAKKVKAVSRVRAITGASLKDCKSFVDELSL